MESDRCWATAPKLKLGVVEAWVDGKAEDNDAISMTGHSWQWHNTLIATFKSTILLQPPFPILFIAKDLGSSIQPFAPMAIAESTLHHKIFAVLRYSHLP